MGPSVEIVLHHVDVVFEESHIENHTTCLVCDEVRSFNTMLSILRDWVRQDFSDWEGGGGGL